MPEITYIPVDKLRKSRYNPRIVKDPEKFQALLESIKKDGIKKPLLVWQRSIDEYEVLDGSRRLEAARTLGLRNLPCIVEKGRDKPIAEMTLRIHISQEDLTPEEIVNAVQTLVAKGFYQTEREACKALTIPWSTYMKWKRDAKALEKLKAELPSSTIKTIEEAEIPEEKKKRLVEALEETPMSTPIVKEMVGELERNPEADVEKVVEKYAEAEPRQVEEDFYEARGEYLYQLRYSGGSVEFTMKKDGLTVGSISFPRKDLWIVRRLFQKL